MFTVSLLLPHICICISLPFSFRGHWQCIQFTTPVFHKAELLLHRGVSVVLRTTSSTAKAGCFFKFHPRQRRPSLPDFLGSLTEYGDRRSFQYLLLKR